MWFWAVCSLLSLLTIVYSFIMIYLRVGLGRLRPGQSSTKPSISVVVPARDEQENIGRCLVSLLQQDYPHDKYEIIVVNDGSSDGTEEIVAAMLTSNPRLKLISVPQDTGHVSPKKRAVSEGINTAHGNVIFTIDADCAAPRTWLSSMVRLFDRNVHMVCGWVKMDRKLERTLFHKVQSLEFLGLVAAGGGAIGLRQPITNNGANLAYCRSAFFAAKGFDDSKRLASGDDVFLLHKLNGSLDGAVRFCPSSDACVSTRPLDRLGTFVQQRLRWASKILALPSISMRFVLIAAYLYYVTLSVTTLLCALHINLIPVVLSCLSLKLVSDGFLMGKACSMAKRRDLLFCLPIAELFHISYILVVGPASLVCPFRWKGRQYKKRGML